MKKFLLFVLYLTAPILFGQINTMTFNGTSTIEAGVEFSFSTGLFENSTDGTTMDLFDNHPYATPINGGGDYKDILISESIYITTVNVTWATNVELFKLQFLNGTTVVKELSSLTIGDVSVNATANKIRYFDEGLSSSGGFELASVSWESPAELIRQGAHKAFYFDGNNNYINLGNADTDGISQISVEAWVKHLDAGDDRVVCKSTGTAVIDHTFSMGLANNQIRVRINGQGDYDGATTISTGQWYHIAFTYSGTQVKIYLNGVEDNSYNVTLGNIANSSQDVMVGNVNAVDNRYFYGDIDEVKIWNKALTESEIRTNMCKTISSSDANLIGYWKFNTNTGNVTIDEKGNNNGTLMNMSVDDLIWSGAAIGDTSIFDYIGTAAASSYSATLSAVDGDSFSATGASGTFNGIQVYRTDVQAQRTNSTIPTSWKTDAQKYWGVFAIGTNPTYDIVYSYDENSGLWNEGFLALAMRDNNNDDSWEDLTATLDEVNNTLIKTSQNNLEYTLAETNYVLPIELVLFEAKIMGKNIELNWTTETEENNIGFEIQRKNQESSLPAVSLEDTKIQDEKQSWETIGFIKGYGHSNSPKYYSFTYENIYTNSNYLFRLKQLDNDGSYEYSKIVELVQPVPSNFSLSQNYPNPFNPSTTINYTIPTVVDANFASTTNVKLKVYDILGNEVATLVNEQQSPGSYNITFDASEFTTGIYFYTIRAGDFVATKKMLFVK